MDTAQKSPQEILEKFQKWYSPTESIDQATDMFSTDEIVEALNQFDPSLQIDPNSIFEFMTGLGYKYTPDPGKLTFQLKWMLIRKF